MGKMESRAKGTLLLLACLLLFPTGAWAVNQGPVTAEDLEQLRDEFGRELQLLKSENTELRKLLTDYEISRTEQRLRIDEIELSVDQAEGLTAGYDKGFYIQSPDDKFKLAISGYIQFQGNFFENNDVPDRAKPVFNTGLQGVNRDDTLFIRRARLKFKGHLWTKDLGYTLQVGWDGGIAGMRDAYMQYRWEDWVKVRLGQFKPPFSMENMESSSTLETIERSAIVGILGMGRRTGIMVSGVVLDRHLGYDIMLANRVGFGNAGRNAPDNNDDKAVIGMLTARPFKTSDNRWIKGLTLTAAGATGNNAPDDTQGLTVSDNVSILDGRNRVRVIVPYIGGNQTSFDFGLQWNVDRFKLQGEWLYSHVTRRDIPNTDVSPYGALNLHPIKISGAYVLAAYTIWENEAMKVVPVVKYEWLHVRGDNLVDEIFDANDVLVARRVGSEFDNDFRAFTAGVTWHVNPKFKIMANWVFEDIGSDLIGSTRLERGENQDQNLWMIRSQIKF